MPKENPKKIVAVIEFFVEGHQPTLLLVHVRALLELGHEVWVFHPNAALFDGLPKNYTEHLKIHTCKEVDPDMRRPLWLGLLRKALSFVSPDWPRALVATWLWRKSNRIVRQAVKKHGRQPDQVIFMTLETLIAAPFPLRTASRFRYSWIGRCTNLKDKSGHFKADWKRVGLWRVEKCNGLIILDETTVEALQTVAGKPVYFYPDPTDESVESKGAFRDMILEKARGRKVVLLAGTITSRKGTMSFLRAIRASDAAKFFFVIVGKLYEKSFEADELAELRAFALHPPENCFVFLERIADEQNFNALIQAADIVYAAYIGFPGSSGILTKTALFKKPVIVSKHFLMEQRVRTFNMGIAVEPFNIDEIVQAFSTLAADEGKNDRRYKEYFDMHSYARLKEVLGEFLSGQR